MKKGAAKESQRIIFDTKYFTGYTGEKQIEDEDGTLTVDKRRENANNRCQIMA